MGETPEGVDIESIPGKVAAVRDTGRLKVLARTRGRASTEGRPRFHRESLPFHPNGMRFTALDAQGAPLRARVYYSVGGGFVVDESARPAAQSRDTPETRAACRIPSRPADELLKICAEHDLSISDVMLANEKTVRSEADDPRRAAADLGRHAGMRAARDRHAGRPPRASA